MISRRGFTLVEVLVGIAVAALVLTAGFTALSFVRDRAVHAEEATVAALTGATTRGLLTEWLNGAVPRAPNRGERFQGLDSDEHGTPSDELIFPTRARTPLGVGTTVVRLYVDSDNATVERGLVAELTERATDEPRLVELFPTVTSIELRYLPDVEDATEWIESWVGSRSLPRAVELILFTEPPDTLPTLLRFPLRVALETPR